MTVVEKLRRSTFQYIESEIYDYDDALKEMRMIEYENLHRTSTETDDPQSGRSSVRTITDETARKATALESHTRYKRMEYVTNAIAKVYDSLDSDDKRKLIKLYYWDRPGELTWDGVAKELHMSKRTAMRWRRAFVYAVAKEIGER